MAVIKMLAILHNHPTFDGSRNHLTLFKLDKDTCDSMQLYVSGDKAQLKQGSETLQKAIIQIVICVSVFASMHYAVAKPVVDGFSQTQVTKTFTALMLVQLVQTYEIKLPPRAIWDLKFQKFSLLKNKTGWVLMMQQSSDL